MPFRTKPQLARVMLDRALEAEIPASWVTADEVYGGDPALRGWLEDRDLSYVLAVKGSEPPLSATSGSATAVQLAAAVPVEQWVACGAGHGAKGRRLYDWARSELAAPAAPGTARWAAGTRWAVEDGFQQAKTEVGLDHYEVRRWPGWYRHITLALLGPYLLGRHPDHGHRPRKGGCGRLTNQLGLLPLTVPEVRRLWSPWCGPPPSRLASCWPGHDGVDAIRPAPDEHTLSVANGT